MKNPALLCRAGRKVKLYANNNNRSDDCNRNLKKEGDIKSYKA